MQFKELSAPQRAVRPDPAQHRAGGRAAPHPLVQEHLRHPDIQVTGEIRSYYLWEVTSAVND